MQSCPKVRKPRSNSEVLQKSEDVVGKYAAAEMIKGEYVLAAKISDTPASENAWSDKQRYRFGQLCFFLAVGLYCNGFIVIALAVGNRFLTLPRAAR